MQEAERPRIEAFLVELRDQTRIPDAATSIVVVGDLSDAIVQVPQSDIDIMGLQPDPAFIRQMVKLIRSSCMFVNDSYQILVSGQESALA